ncbi:MAG: DUF2779 domain-containing protein, partial [Clostridia bacterium]|nr:DUF2779 domain-containing protein [Clostridia bacterium]
MIISKGKYLKYSLCPKSVWIEKNKSDLLPKKNLTVPLYNPIKIIDEFSQKLFNSVNACHFLDENKEKFDYQKMLVKTQELIKRNVPSIYKATFEYNGLYFVVDILKKVKKGFIVYLVRPSKVLRQNFLVEMAYISYVLQKLGVKIYRHCIVTICQDFVKNGEIDPKKYFKINYVGNKIKYHILKIEDNLKGYKELMESNLEPNIEYGNTCPNHHSCTYIDICRKPLPTPSVFDLYGCSKKLELYSKNILSFQDILNNDIVLSPFQQRQIDFTLNNLPMYVDKENLKGFIKKFSYPLYFLDFETTQEEFPEFDGIGPFEQIPFQYSLHYIKEEGGEVFHTEYLAKENEDPRIDLVKQLVNDIPKDACIVAYNVSFEKRVITNLAKIFPQYYDHLMNLTKNFVDLIEPFEKGYVYDKLMGGSFSLKSVLPALFPNDPD